MNSIFAVLFVIGVTLIGKWLLFDDDRPEADTEPLPMNETSPEAERNQLSKSA